MLFIPILLGTGRKGRQSEKVAQFVIGQAKKYGQFKTELIDSLNFGLSRTDDTKTSQEAKKFSETMTRADGLIVVSPEYNHGLPGELKMTLDQLYKEYKRKPVGICGVSEGHMGGARMVEQLRLVSIELQMVPIRTAVYFFDVENIFDELVWYANALKIARQKV